MADTETVYEEITLDDLVESDAGLKKLMDALLRNNSCWQM